MRNAFTLIAAAITSLALAQTITVTTSADTSDVPSSGMLADLPGPDGVVSFREALKVSDNEPGRQTIGFAIPEDDWYLPGIFPGLVLLQGSFSLSAMQPVVIDGTTQTAFTGDTNPDGHEIVLPLQTYLNGGDSVVTGLYASRVEVGGSGSDIYNNNGGMDIRLVLATDSVVHNNEADNINITYSSDNLVVGNTTERIRITGLGPASPAANNVIGGPNPADRNSITGFGNYGEHGNPAGDCIEMYYTENTLIQNNYIGTTPDGMAIGNRACTVGIAMQISNHNVYIRENLIAIQATHATGGGRLGAAIYIEQYEGGQGVKITGNTLGLNALGAPVLGGKHGIWVSRFAFEYDARILIGGANPGEGNVIAGHASTGVLMMNGPGIPSVGRVRLSGNSIYNNDEIGIDLMPNTWDFGATPNDPLDLDDGANGLQSFPVIDSAERTDSLTTVGGSLNSFPSQAYEIEFFASSSCDASGFGQGELFLGSTPVVTDAAGNAAFSAMLPQSAPVDSVITATATQSSEGATSEFSVCVPVVNNSCPADLAEPIGRLDFADVVTFLTAFAERSPGADLAAPLGQWDISDVIAFLTAFGAGCP